MYEIYTSVHVLPPNAPDITQDDKLPSFMTLVEETLQSRVLIHERNEEVMSKDLKVSLPKHLLHRLYHFSIPGQTNAQKNEENSPPIPNQLNGGSSINPEAYGPKHLLDICYRLFIGTQNNVEQNVTRPQTSRTTKAERITRKPHVKRSPRVIPSAIELE